MVGEGINPFNYSSPVRRDDLINRRSQLDRIGAAASSANNTRLAAPRRYGKTSLLKAALVEAEAQGFIVVYVDFFGVLDLADIAERVESAYGAALTGPLAHWLTALRRTLRPVVRLGGGPVPAQVELSAAGTDPLLERLDLPVRVHHRTDKRVLIAFDEFQDVLLVPGADAVIRSAIQHHAEAASYVFAGSQMHLMAELFSDKRRAFYGQARPIPLHPLAPEDLGAFVAGRFSDTGKDVGAALGPYLDGVAGHPQRAMLVANILWEVTPGGEEATEETWGRAWEQALIETTDESRTVWSSLPPNSRRMLALVAGGTGRPYSQASGVSRGSSTTGAIAHLVDRGEMLEDPTAVSGYRVTDPLLAAWVRAGRHGA
jgi:hypothetical protein